MPATRLLRFIKSQPVRERRPSRRPERTRTNFIWVSAPNVVPFAVTNRTEKRNRAGCVRVVRSFIAAYHVAGCWPSAKTASRVAMLACRDGVRTFAAACGCQASLSCFVGTLAAVPGSVAMLAHHLITHEPLPCFSTIASTTSTIFACCRRGSRDTASKACRALPAGFAARDFAGLVPKSSSDETSSARAIRVSTSERMFTALRSQ